MAEWSGFFDAHLVNGSYDRSYLAEHFAKYFSRLVGDGVFAKTSNSLQVFQASTANMSVVVAPGGSWIEGYTYDNDSDLSLTIRPADGSLDRIDIVVNQWSSVDRQIKTVVKTGTPAIKPVPPSVQRSADYKELKLAEIRVPAGATKITQPDITDYRANTAVCGWVTGLLTQVDTSTLFEQWRVAYEEEYRKTTDYLAAQKAAWDTFFKSVQLDLILPVPSIDKAGFCVRVNSAGTGYELVKTRLEYSRILRADSWEGSSAPYVQSVSIEELESLQGADVHPVYEGTLEQKETLAEAAAEIKYASYAGNTITFECWEETPKVDLPIVVGVTR